jgi:hypothetical protein
MAWKAFAQNEEDKAFKNKGKKPKADFVDTWLNFFENYSKK